MRLRIKCDLVLESFWLKYNDKLAGHIRIRLNDKILVEFDKFMIFGWRITVGPVKLTYGLDAHGNYHSFVMPGYRTYIREGRCEYIPAKATSQRG